MIKDYLIKHKVYHKVLVMKMNMMHLINLYLMIDQNNHFINQRLNNKKKIIMMISKIINNIFRNVRDMPV